MTNLALPLIQVGPSFFYNFHMGKENECWPWFGYQDRDGYVVTSH